MLPFLPAVLTKETAFRNYPGICAIDTFLVRADYPLLIIIARFGSAYGNRSFCSMGKMFRDEFWIKMLITKLLPICHRMKHYYNLRLQPFLIQRNEAAVRELRIDGKPLRCRYQKEDPLFSIFCVTCGVSTYDNRNVRITVCTQCTLPFCDRHKLTFYHQCASRTHMCAPMCTSEIFLA